MTAIGTAIDARTPEARANRERMGGLVAELRGEVERIRQGGGEQARQRHLSRGKLLPRDRVRALIDPASPFLEFSQLAAHGMYGEPIPAAGIVTGIGMIRPSRKERCPSFPASGSTPITRQPGECAAAASADPARRPPPPMQTRRTSSGPVSAKSSSAAVPWPAMTSGWS